MKKHFHISILHIGIKWNLSTWLCPDTSQNVPIFAECSTFFCSHKFYKIVNYFIFKMPKKNIWANFQRIIELFSILLKKLSLSSQKYGFGIRDPDPDPQHWFSRCFLFKKDQSCAHTISVEEYKAYEHEKRVPVEGFIWILCPPRKSTPVKEKKTLKGWCL